MPEVSAKWGNSRRLRGASVRQPLEGEGSGLEGRVEDERHIARHRLLTARVALSASVTRSFFSFTSTSEPPPTLSTATPPESFASRSCSFSFSYLIPVDIQRRQGKAMEGGGVCDRAA